ncbi:hypothetical protein FV113G1_23800 [Fusobacterium varium]|nr:hypothetical protein FV113G1_23800 [Fusobacterium varium]
MANSKSVSVEEAAKILGQGLEKVRRSLIQGVAPFGYAVKMGNQWSYHISRAKLYDYLGYEYEKEKAPEEPASSTSANV